MEAGATGRVGWGETYLFCSRRGPNPGQGATEGSSGDQGQKRVPGTQIPLQLHLPSAGRKLLLAISGVGESGET